MRDDQFLEVLSFFGLSREGYRRVRRGVKKRLRSHMLGLGSRTVREYLQRLEADGRERAEAERLLTVPVSRFFRDLPLWLALEREVLPARALREAERIRVWSAGCGCGEEPYSLKILWQALEERSDALPPLDLCATDTNPVVLEKARQGIYGASSLKEIPEALRAAFFQRVPGENRFALSGSVKEGIQWRLHDLVRQEPPSQGFHLIFLRNSLLTYYEDGSRKHALRRIASVLRPRGLLVIGKKERLPAGSRDFVPLTKCPYAFGKVS